MEEKPVKKGETVIRQGDDGDYLYIVEEGFLRCTQVEPGRSEEVFLKDYHSGFFGEIALLYQTPRAASIVALEDS